MRLPKFLLGILKEVGLKNTILSDASSSFLALPLSTLIKCSI